MSVGVWTLLVFSGFAASALFVIEGRGFFVQLGVPLTALRGTTLAVVSGTALSGAVLATYTGVLLGATVVPAWAAHHKLLPFHFGMVGLGSAAAVLELLGFRIAALNAIGLAVAAAETVAGVVMEVSRRGAARGAIHHGTPGRLLRTAALLTGPVALILRIAGWVPIAGVGFLMGAIFSRYGWIFAGRDQSLITNR